MRSLLIASLTLLAACPLATPESEEPTQPTPDAATAPTPTPSTFVFAASFDQFCTRDDECVAVFEGNACQSNRCANAAIRRDALPEYRSEIGAYWSCYSPQGSCSAVIGDPAICVAGRCTLPGL